MSRRTRDTRQGELFTPESRAAEPPASIDRAGLLRRLASPGSERLTVLTPNLRLAQALVAEVDALHLAERRSHWEAPDVLSFDAFLKRCHDEALYSPAGGDVPALLSEQAERLLWEEAIRASRWSDSLLSSTATAALAAEAWALAHAWRIEGALRAEASSEDVEAFAAWAEHYAGRSAREALTDAARLPSVVAPLLRDGRITRPAALVLYAFDMTTPQQADFVAACELGGIDVLRCGAPRHAGSVARTVAATPRAELELAARWARTRLESAAGRAARIAVVVPELQQRRREVARVFSRVFAPSGPAPGVERPAFFNISLGEPLDQYPLVDAALGLIELASGAVAYDRVSRLLRSPFVGGAEAELSERARLDAALRQAAPATLTLPRLCVLVSELVDRGRAPGCSRLARCLDKLLEAGRTRDRVAPYEWARRFTRVLEAAGFPGERTLDSPEFQALEKWRETLRAFSALGALAPGWSETEARARLRRLCGDTIFQPRSGEAPVQVLGLLESVGLEFEHLWVSGLTEEAWPLAARLHPLISPALQRRAGIPQATPEKAFEIDQRITAGWKGAAREVVFSNARADGDRELLTSPLVADVGAVEVGALDLNEYASRRDLLFAKRKVEHACDEAVPPIAGESVQGGTGILADQAACPFRAFAHYRLDARELETPEPGLGPQDRGKLLHELMATIWESLRDHATLIATDAAALDALIAEAAKQAIESVREKRPGRLDGRFADLEAERLAAVAREWLDIERARPPFEVHMREEKLPLRAGRLRIDGRIDRIDRLSGGGIAVIDYKTGRAGVADWMGERPDDVQLPLYALAAADQEVRAVAFARLRTGDRRFIGLSRDADVIPGVTPVTRTRQTWDELVAQWRRAVETLGGEFAQGEARVEPKEMLATCRRCDLKALCRVHERLTPLDAGDEVVDTEKEEAS